MATRKTKNSEDEKLDAATLERVINLLEPTEEGVKPITKKDACAILCITYNTTRLGTLIEKFKEKKLRDKERRNALRGKPATPGEIQFCIERYLEGGSIEAISNSIYRSSAFVKGLLDKYEVPIRSSAYSYLTPPLIPEGTMRTRFKVGESVYSARYDSVAVIHVELFQNDQWVYRIWLKSEKWQQFAYQEAAELASMEHIIKLGVTL